MLMLFMTLQHMILLPIHNNDVDYEHDDAAAGGVGNAHDAHDEHDAADGAVDDDTLTTNSIIMLVKLVLC